MKIPTTNKMRKAKCSFCPNEVEWTCGDNIEEAMVYGGACNWFTCGYGSKFDGEQLLIVICDVCLEKADIRDRKDYLFKEKK